MALEINFVVYLGNLDLDIIEFSGYQWLYDELNALGTVIHPDEYETLLQTQKLRDEHIIRLIDENIAGIEPGNYTEELEAFAGGFLMEYGGKFLAPQCCATIADAKGWQDMTSRIWKSVWIGHPWVYYKVDEKYIYFSELTEKEKPNYDIQFQMDLELFQSALNEAFQYLEQFRNRCKRLIQEGDYENKEFMIERLLYGHG